MSYSGSGRLQRAVIERLLDTSMVDVGLVFYDDVPQETAMPYGVYDSSVEIPDDTFGQRGHDIAFRIVVYTAGAALSRTGRGVAGFKLGAEYADLIIESLTDLDNPVVVEDHDLVDLRVDLIESFRQDDDVRRTEITFTASLEDNAVE